MRKDVIEGVLAMYEREDNDYPKEHLEIVRILVSGTMRGENYSPWMVHELNSLIEIENLLDPERYTVNEALDTAITCVYDMHNVNWAVGWNMSYCPKTEEKPFSVERLSKRRRESVFHDSTCEDRND